MLMPKRVKHRRVFRGRMKGSAHRGNTISYGEYGTTVRQNIDPDATYYIVTDTYTSQYGPNRLTEVARYDETTFARDLLAEYVKAGGLK